MKARIVYDEKLKGYKVEIEVEEGEEIIPVGRKVNEELDLWEIVVWDTYEQAKEWIDNSGGRVQLVANL